MTKENLVTRARRTTLEEASASCNSHRIEKKLLCSRSGLQLKGLDHRQRHPERNWNNPRRGGKDEHGPIRVAPSRWARQAIFFERAVEMSKSESTTCWPLTRRTAHSERVMEGVQGDSAALAGICSWWPRNGPLTKARRPDSLGIAWTESGHRTGSIWHDAPVVTGAEYRNYRHHEAARAREGHRTWPFIADGGIQK